MKITKKSKSNVRKNKDAKKMKKPQAKIQAKIQARTFIYTQINFIWSQFGY